MKWTDTGGGDFEQPPAGTHIARCIKMIDIGTQRGEYQGKANSKRQVIIGFELPLELLTEGDYAGKPVTVSRFYTASLSEKSNLRKDLANWRGRDFTQQELLGFDSKNILDKGCMLSLTPNDKGKIRITGIMSLPKGSQLPPRVNPLVFFSLEPGEFDRATFDGLSDGIKKFITLSPEYESVSKGVAAPAKNSAADLEDDIPF